VRANEILGQVLLSWHNLAFFQALMAEMRAAISAGTMTSFRDAFAARQAVSGSDISA
jgi:queuine tRNA-ribosyltransferase